MIDLEALQKSKGQIAYKKAKKIIPGGTQLLSKRPEMFAPGIWPSYYSKAKGSRVWDLDNQEFIDMSIMSVGACILGYADEDVDNIVIDAIKKGVSSSLNCYEEIDLASLLLEMHPWFDSVRYARSGGEAMSIAVRIARARTSKDVIMFSGYHGWNDWYLAANLNDDSSLDGQLMPGLEPKGVPRGLEGTSYPFDSSDISSLENNKQVQERKVAAIVIEPARGKEPVLKDLIAIKDLAKGIGAVLIYDEITSGFRMCNGGIHRKFDVNPDMAVFAKSMANGYAMSAILGTDDTMDAAQSTFISSTNWTDRVGPSAAIATINKYRDVEADIHIIKLGNKVRDIWQKASNQSGLNISISGLPTLSSFSFDHPRNQELSTRLVSEMLQRGFLAFRQFKPSFAHSLADLELYEEKLVEVFMLLSNIQNDKIIINEQAHSGFHRLTKE
jgi:glutamate-1-semialdehyde aminotransferase